MVAKKKKTSLRKKKESKDIIVRDDLIADVVEKYPQLSEIFLDFGVHCVGCYVSEYETIEQGILGHGFSEEELEDFLKAINEVISDPEFSSEPVD